MKISINDEIIYESSENSLNYINSFVNEEIAQETIKNHIRSAAASFFNSYKDKLKNEWLPILFKRVKQIPTDDDELFALIKSQPDYLTQKQKEAKEKAKREAGFKVS